MGTGNLSSLIEVINSRNYDDWAGLTILLPRLEIKFNPTLIPTLVPPTFVEPGNSLFDDHLIFQVIFILFPAKMISFRPVFSSKLQPSLSFERKREGGDDQDETKRMRKENWATNETDGVN